MIEPTHPQLSIARQCDLLGIARSSWYYQPKGETADNLALMRLLDEQYTQTPFYGVERMTAWLRQQGLQVNPKRVRRLLRLMGLEALYPKPRLSLPGDEERRYPYLLRGRPITAVNDVWSTDITYVRMQHGFLYLVAVLDWYSRYVLSTRASAWRRWKRPCATVSRVSSILTRASSSPAPSTPADWNKQAFRSVGTGAAGRWIMSSLNASGVRSSGRRSISTTTKRSPTRCADSTAISASTTRSGRTKRYSTRLLRRSSLPDFCR